ncbi:threonine transporter RhtB [Pelistega indica]|uniref:Threonine transporter RhtB n=1 Tax=Pelistega indica TaxID=1414851 RepID=V8G0T7_9BURK|nr:MULTISPECIES: LysE family translocator [Pelistega]ETD70035.1 threonine transporter RhtB [Pelistega indica]
MPLDILISFFGVSILLALSPGPDNIFVLLQSALYGAKVGFFIILGLCTGLIFHTLLVTFGVATLIKTSPTAFLILKIIGATYLLYLAYLTAKSKPMTLDSSSQKTNSPLSYGQYYRRGILMNVTNPKVTLFFLAFLPQFLYSSSITATQQLISLSALFMLATFITFNTIAYFSGTFGRIIKQSPKAQYILNIVTVIVFVGLAIKLFF